MVSYQRLSSAFNPAHADALIAWAEEDNHYILDIAHPGYPPCLKTISHPPLFLFVSGQVELLLCPQIAIVGSRKPTPSGAETAYEFAADLAQRGYIITSGLALGVDGQAHRGAMRTGKTIAVLGSGFNHLYPPQHRNLAEQILTSGGTLVTEYPLDYPPRRLHFPQRNRIIAGLSLGVLVAEAKLKSGSLITARFALEEGREVFAIPGSIHNAMAKGCNELLRQGACLVEKTQDIIDELPLKFSQSHHSPKSTLEISCLDKDKQLLVKCVGYEATSVDKLVDRTQFTAQTVNSMCVELELAGYIRATDGGYMRIC